MTGIRGPETHGRRAWTNRDVDRLRAIIAGGGTYVDAVKALDRSINAVRKMGIELGLRVTPEARSRQQAALSAARWQDPAYRPRQSDGCKRGWAGNDARREATSKRSKARGVMQKCAEKTRDRRSEISRKASANRLKGYLDWCPPEYREERRRLIYSRHLRAAEADAIIRAKIEADKERSLEAEAARNGWSPAFVALLQKAAAGQVRLIERQPLARPEPQHSPMGCATGML